MKVIVTAGGTGGHIYPALAIINKIKEKEKNVEFLYIGTCDRMEKDIIPSLNIPFKSLNIKGLKRKLTLENIKIANLFIKSIKEAKKIIKEFNPDIVIGAGGYVTAPVIYAAKKAGYKTLIHEQNSELGATNKFLLKYVDVLCVSLKKTAENVKCKKVVFTGNPCGEQAFNVTPADKKSYNLSEYKKLVVISMGSLGSTTINNLMTKMLPLFNNKTYEILFVTGKKYYEKYSKINVSSNIKIVPYIENMKALLKKTDVLISRAGASTISEIIALKLPTIMIPSPYVTNNHQLKNAMDLKNENAALVIEERDLHGDILVRTTEKLLEDRKLYKEIQENLKKFDIPLSATKIYNEISLLMKEK